MTISTGDIVAIAAVGINALVYISGIFKINATVESLSKLAQKLEITIDNMGARMTETEKAVGIIEHNCSLLHGGRRP